MNEYYDARRSSRQQALPGRRMPDRMPDRMPAYQADGKQPMPGVYWEQPIPAVAEERRVPAMSGYANSQGITNSHGRLRAIKWRNDKQSHHTIPGKYISIHFNSFIIFMCVSLTCQTGTDAGRQSLCTGEGRRSICIAMVVMKLVSVCMDAGRQSLWRNDKQSRHTIPGKCITHFNSFVIFM